MDKKTTTYKQSNKSWTEVLEVTTGHPRHLGWEVRKRTVTYTSNPDKPEITYALQHPGKDYKHYRISVSIDKHGNWYGELLSEQKSFGLIGWDVLVKHPFSGSVEACKAEVIRRSEYHKRRSQAMQSIHNPVNVSV